MPRVIDQDTPHRLGSRAKKMRAILPATVAVANHPPAPVVADGVAVAAVPFRPQGREVADLVAPLAQVPGLGDQLDLTRPPGLDLDQVEERRQPVDLVELAGQAGGEVEWKPSTSISVTQ